MLSSQEKRERKGERRKGERGKRERKDLIIKYLYTKDLPITLEN